MRANLVGSSVVSAMTQTPPSGPAAEMTTPPRSLLPISTVASALCCARTRSGWNKSAETTELQRINEARAVRMSLPLEFAIAVRCSPTSCAYGFPTSVYHQKRVHGGDASAIKEPAFGGSPTHARSKGPTVRRQMTCRADLGADNQVPLIQIVARYRFYFGLGRGDFEPLARALRARPWRHAGLLFRIHDSQYNFIIARCGCWL